LRRVISLLPGLFMAALLAGCDRQNPPAPQGNGANAATAAAAPAPPGGAPAAGNETAPTTGRLDRSHAGTAAPALAFQGPDGQPTRLAAFRGRPVLVNLWATWCGPCVVEMPSLDALAGRQTPDRGLRVIAISQDSDPQIYTSDGSGNTFVLDPKTMEKKRSMESSGGGILYTVQP